VPRSNQELIFAFMQAYRGDERESLMLARSLRRFGGRLAAHPLWMMMPEGLEQVSRPALRALGDLGVRVHRFELPAESLEFTFGGKVHAAAAAEDLASNQADVLVWMDSDTVFAGEPAEVLLAADVSLGYRPVMLKNISSLHGQPVDDFWSFIYEGCGTPALRVFPMTTAVDRVRIRAQFNAGIMSVRPRKQLLRTWRDRFERLHMQPQLAAWYREDALYRIFVHQSILSATLLAVLDRDEMRDLGPRLNFPIFVGPPPGGAPDAVSFRYDEFEQFKKPGWEEEVALPEPFKGWLQEQVRA